jgi:hypothetical protein
MLRSRIFILEDAMKSKLLQAGESSKRVSRQNPV